MVRAPQPLHFAQARPSLPKGLTKARRSRHLASLLWRAELGAAVVGAPLTISYAVSIGAEPGSRGRRAD